MDIIIDFNTRTISLIHQLIIQTTFVNLICQFIKAAQF